MTEAVTQLARPLRIFPIMTLVRSVISFENNALHERERQVAGQELRVMVQGLPGEAGEMRPCR